MPSLTDADIRRVAALAKLSVTDLDLPDLRDRISAILQHADNLASLPLDDIEPLTHVGDLHNRLAPDEPGPMLDTQTALAAAPDRYDRFFRVPKVLGQGGGA